MDANKVAEKVSINIKLSIIFLSGYVVGVISICNFDTTR